MRLTQWLTLSGAIFLLSCGGGYSSPSVKVPSGAKVVTIRDFSFSPSALTVKVGTTVVWVNDGPSAHTTVSNTNVWSSGVLSAPSSGGLYGGSSAGGSFQFTFNQAGTYPYHCSLHPPSQYPNFTGTITVTP